MKKKKPRPERTLDAQIKSSLRLLFLRSVERASAIRRDHNTCTTCGAKGSVAKGKEVKTEVHHTIGSEGRDIDWKRIYDVIREELLCAPEGMITLCKPCHYGLHGKTVPKERKKK